MASDSRPIISQSLAGRLMKISAALALSAAICVALSMTVPISTADTSSRSSSGGSLEPLPTSRSVLQPLLARMAGTVLIRPAAVQAAVKNDGTADRLLKKLKLQGIVQMGQDRVAYVQVEKEGVKTVRKGQTILDFAVDSIEPGKVTLSLQGVVVVLDH
jgi:hypothetical protein